LMFILCLRGVVSRWKSIYKRVPADSVNYSRSPAVGAWSIEADRWIIGHPHRPDAAS